jgi:hypothetical protein
MAKKPYQAPTTALQPPVKIISSQPAKTIAQAVKNSKRVVDQANKQ